MKFFPNTVTSFPPVSGPTDGVKSIITEWGWNRYSISLSRKSNPLLLTAIFTSPPANEEGAEHRRTDELMAVAFASVLPNLHIAVSNGMKCCPRRVTIVPASPLWLGVTFKIKGSL
jgi:hypothetical protein